MHPIITNSKLPADRLPTSGLACTICPMATWFSTPIAMSVFCGKMFLVVWASDKKTPIIECSAQQDALLEQQALTVPPAESQPLLASNSESTVSGTSGTGYGLLAPEGTVLANPPSESTFL